MGVPGTNGQLLRCWVGNYLNDLCSESSSNYPKTQAWARAATGAVPVDAPDSLLGFVQKVTNYPNASSAPVTSNWEPGAGTGANTTSFVDFIETQVEQACLHQDPNQQDIWDWLEGDAPSSPTSVPADIVAWLSAQTEVFAKQPSSPSS